jgi:5-methylthioadenosine/S-adenosylhomocysteine deaminase
MLSTSRPTALPREGSYILESGTVLTPDGPQQDHIIAVRDGVIAYTGTPEDLPYELAALPRVPLPSSVVMPGMVDGHNHATQAFAKSVAGGEPAQLWKRMWVPLSASMNAEDYFRSGKWTAAELLRGGITTVAVSGEPHDERGLAALAGMLETGIRVVYGFGFGDLSDYTSKSKPTGTPPTTGQALAAAERLLGSGLDAPRLSVSLAAGTVHTATPELLRGLSGMARDLGALFQFHANEHTPEIEYSLDRHGRRPIELLADIGALGQHVLLAHCTLVTAHEKAILADTCTGVSYNPVASAWKGNAVAPALDFAALGVRFGLGTDATRSDGFRLLDAAETAQRLTHSMAVDDFTAGGGQLWVRAATQGGADIVGLGESIGRIAAGYAADLLILDAESFETAPSWDLEWDLVRYYDRSNVQAVYVDGRLVIDAGSPTTFDGEEFITTNLYPGLEALINAPLHKVHDANRLSAYTLESVL